MCCRRYAGILSAVGIHLADIVQEAQEPTATQLSGESLPELSSRLQALAATAVDKLRAQGFDEQHIAVENFLNLRCAPAAAGVAAQHQAKGEVPKTVRRKQLGAMLQSCLPACPVVCQAAP